MKGGYILLKHILEVYIVVLHKSNFMLIYIILPMYTIKVKTYRFYVIISPGNFYTWEEMF